MRKYSLEKVERPATDTVRKPAAGDHLRKPGFVLPLSAPSFHDYEQYVPFIDRISRGVRNIIPFRVRPMMATLVSEPFDEPGWVYEEKYDGIRILAYKEGSKVTLLSRNDKDRTASFPGIVATIRALPASTLLLDGEVIALDRDKISRFQMLQRGGRARYAVFDCAFLNGDDLRHETLTVRQFLRIMS